MERTTRAQVQAAAQKLTLDTAYFLKGKEEPMVSKEIPPHRGRKSITRSRPTACTSMWTGGLSFRRAYAFLPPTTAAWI